MHNVSLSVEQLTGQTESHLTPVPDESVLLHTGAVHAYEKMREDAAKVGVTMAIASGFRSLQRQLTIWNKKWRGELPLRSKEGEVIAQTALPPEQLMHAILHWSALPASSRHHWGTDFDVYDPRPFASGEQSLQLIPAEYCDDRGPCYRLWQWLTQHAHEYGFFFPYARYQGGVAQEPWHLSYRPLSSQLRQQLSIPVLRQTLASLPLEGQSLVDQQLEAIYKQYIDNICEDNGWTNPWCGYSSF